MFNILENVICTAQRIISLSWKEKEIGKSQIVLIYITHTKKNKK